MVQSTGILVDLSFHSKQASRTCLYLSHIHSGFVESLYGKQLAALLCIDVNTRTPLGVRGSPGRSQAIGVSAGGALPEPPIP